ncbi:discoidin domain-containing protein [Nocardia sp. NEAU-G5]|uniref:Discoidin domain-containing protein n=1 Tax=Nocardia albiluteola TaxID=2842303 RepID=A0ABS6BC62_9NOCA|nr:discoidin domain-containing protein [Nocardia albiluteola]MBU3067000.1 discoidin domain-containing protein [Nocardia albiluteola]
MSEPTPTGDPRTGTDLIVPVRVHTLVVNQRVKQDEPFNIWLPDFRKMLERTDSAEPAPGQSLQEAQTGVHVQWELPEALTAGHFHPETGETTFPLVPNRWLVVRHYNGLDGQRKVAAWVVHSDYLERADGGLGRGTSRYVTTRKPGGGTGAPDRDTIGRRHDLKTGPWTEPPTHELFLTTVGPGLPAFAAYAPYHEDVFCVRDSLEDIRAEFGTVFPPDNELSYQVIGWYSDRADGTSDILRQALDIPGLVPPPEEGISRTSQVLDALGWSAPTDAIASTLYCGHSLGVSWRWQGSSPESDRPRPLTPKVSMGHSTADAAEALTTGQTRSPRTGQLVRALLEGTIDTYGTPNGDIELDEATRSAWFAGSNGGYRWEATFPGRQQDSRNLPQWLTDLNSDQAEHDALVPKLERERSRLWSIWWLRNQPAGAYPDPRPPTFNHEADNQLNPDRDGSLAAQVDADMREVLRLRGRIPYGDTPEELAADIAKFRHDKEIPDDVQLRRVGRDPFYRPADPVVVIEGAGSGQPLTRDLDDPLPCRVPSALVTQIQNDSSWQDPPSRPLPDLTNLPDSCRNLLREFALLDWAALTASASGPGTVLSAALADPGNRVRGPLPEYTAAWRQAWVPMYLQWDLRLCATPFRSNGTDNWYFDGNHYQWLGRGATPGTGDYGLRWMTFKERAFLTPSAPYILREQARRYLNTYPESETAGLAQLRADYATMDLLSQSLDGFNDWLLERTGSAQSVPEVSALFGDPETVPNPGSPGGDLPESDRFQAVRAGQFYFRDLRIIDRFGRACDITNPSQDNYLSFPPYRALSVTPSKPISDQATSPRRFFQLPPRIMQEARVRLDNVPAQDNSPVVGWLLLNYLDQALLVYAPDGSPLGEMRVVGDRREIAWNPLPHAPFADPADPGFSDAYPELSDMVVALRARTPDEFDAVLELLDQSLDTIADDAAEADASPARLLGRPLALLRADLTVELAGPPITRPGWQHVLNPPSEDYPTYTWPVRLGDNAWLTDGLVGYFAGANPGDPIDYRLLNTVLPPTESGYMRRITDGHDLAVPAKPTGDLVIRQLTLLADPHAAIHATTDILPVAALRLPADQIAAALDRIRASFRLDPLLAPLRVQPVTAFSSLLDEHGDGLAELVDGNLGTSWRSPRPARAGDWIVLDLEAPHPIRRVDLYPGNTAGAMMPPDGFLETSEDGQTWTRLSQVAPGGDLHLTPPEPPTARYLRFVCTADSSGPIALRSLTVTTDDAGGVLMPRPAAWHGTWSWAEPWDSGTEAPGWGELPIVPVDLLSYPDDPVPVARAGYLQLRPGAERP